MWNSVIPALLANTYTFNKRLCGGLQFHTNTSVIGTNSQCDVTK